MSFEQTIPNQFRAGDSASWTASHSDYPASDGWTMKFVLVKAASRHEITGIENEDGWDFAVTPAVSENWEPGEYRWVAFVTKDESRYTVADGPVFILTDLAAAQNGIDVRSDATVMLEAVTLVLRGQASAAMESRQVSTSAGTMALKFVPRDVLFKMRAQLKAEVAQELIEDRLNNGQDSGRRIVARIAR